MEKPNTDAGLRREEAAAPSLSRSVLHPLYAAIGEMGADPAGILYSAKYEADGSKVLVKVLTPGLSVDMSAWKDPPEAALRLRDTVTGLHKERLIVLAYPKATPLKRILARQGQMTVRPALSIAVQVLRTLHHFHERGHLFRTLNPGALYLSRTPKGKLTVRFAFLGLAPSPMPVNYEAYRPPEAAAGEHLPSTADDLWAAAVLLYEMMFGLTPFSAGNSEGTLGEGVYFPPSMASQHPEVVEALNVALQANPEARFPGAKAFLQALTGETLEGEAVSGEVSAPVPSTDSESAAHEASMRRSTERSSLPTVPSPPRASLVGETLLSDDETTRPYSIPPLEPAERGRESRGEARSGRVRLGVWIAAAAVLFVVPTAIWFLTQGGETDEMSSQSGETVRTAPLMPAPAANRPPEEPAKRSRTSETRPLIGEETEADSSAVSESDAPLTAAGTVASENDQEGDTRSGASKRRRDRKKRAASTEGESKQPSPSPRQGPTDNLSSNPFPLKNNPFPGSN